MKLMVPIEFLRYICSRRLQDFPFLPFTNNQPKMYAILLFESNCVHFPCIMGDKVIRENSREKRGNL